MKRKSRPQKLREKSKKKHPEDIEKLTFEEIDQQNQKDAIIESSEVLPQDIKSLEKTQELAWRDINDEQVSIDISKIARLRKLRKTDQESIIPGDQYQSRLQDFYTEKLNSLDFFKWGSVYKDPEEAIQSDFKSLLNCDIDLFDRKPSELPSTVVSLNKMGSLLRKDEHNAVVQTLDFHQNNEIFVSAGYDKMMKLYSVRKEENYGVLHTDNFKKSLKVLKKVYFEDFPLKKCRFMAKNQQILCSGLKKHILSYDLIHEKTEKFSSSLFTSYFDKNIDNFSISADESYLALNNNKGDLLILSPRNKEFLFHLKSNEPCLTTQFSNDSRFLFTAGESGKIYQWDLNKRRVFDCFSDAGASSIHCIDNNDGYFASGGTNGIVNIYDRDHKSKKLNRTPLKEVQNLTTTISDLEINKKGEMMVIASKWKKNSVRVVHLPSKTVFCNWPNLKTKLQFVTAMKLSDNCKYMALGNDEGNVFLYNFKHYN